MIIIWYADFDGTDENLIKVNRIFDEITKNIGGTVDGAYYPQTEALCTSLRSKTMNGLIKY